MNEEEKKTLLLELDNRIGNDITELDQIYEVDNEVALKKAQLQTLLNAVNNEVPSKLSAAIKKAERNSRQIENFRIKSEAYKTKVYEFLNKIQPLCNEMSRQFDDIHKLEEVMLYLQSFEKIDDLSSQLKTCNDDEQAVLLYGELKAMSIQYLVGHRASYIREYTHYWHNILKDKLSKQYEDLLKILKWPITAPVQEASPPPKDVMTKFSNLTKYLLLIEEPKFVASRVSGDFSQDLDPCLPVKILLLPLKKRFTFHFTGSRQTARIDRPEWFLTQTLTWIKDHQGFLRRHIQPVADRLQMRNVKAEDEFNSGLVALAAERLHTVLGLYQAQGLKGEMVDVDAAFAHAVDETLGFHKELVSVTGKDANSVLTVLTKAETFVKWLAVEKKYALAKMDETLGSPQWMEPVTEVGAAAREPRGADWFLSLLATIEQRYAPLPRPGHKLQFLELQLELLEEWRVRLTQILSASISNLDENSFITADETPNALTSVVNAAHHTRTVLLQWAHSLHYLQLHYYRRQFQQFTQSQHRDDDASIAAIVEDTATDDEEDKEICETMSLKDVEVQAQKLALSEVSRRNSSVTPETPHGDVLSPIMSLMMSLDSSALEDSEDSGVWAEAPALLSHLRDAGLTALADHMLLEFKAKLRDYKRQKWHAMPVLEPREMSVSVPLCRPLSALCARLLAASGKLAPALAARLRSHVASQLDKYIFEEVVLQSWWSEGGTEQLAHDVKRNLVPAFAPPSKVATNINMFPKLREACKILKMELETACRLRNDLLKLVKQTNFINDSLSAISIRHLTPTEVLQILQQRTDLGEQALPSVMELF